MPNEFRNMLLPSNDSGIGGREPGGNGGRHLELELDLELELKPLLDMAMEVELGTGLPKKSQGMFILLCFFGRTGCLLFAFAGFGFGIGGLVRWAGCLWWRLWCRDFHLGGGDCGCTLLWLLWAQDASKLHLHT